MGESIYISFLFADDIPSSVCRDIFGHCLELTRQTASENTENSNESYQYIGQTTRELSDSWLSVEEIRTAIEGDDIPTIKLYYHGFPYLLYVDKHGAANHVPCVLLMLDTVYLDQFRQGKNTDPEGIRVRNNFIDLARRVYDACSPLHAQGYDEAIVDNHKPKMTRYSATSLNYNREKLKAGEIEGILWYNIFRPETVATYGRETLLSAPVWQATELGDGAIELVTHPNPIETRETTDRGEAIAAYLGL